MASGIYCYIDTFSNEIVYVGKDSRIDKNSRHKDHYKKSRYNDQPINRILQKNLGRYEYKVLESGNISSNFLEALEQCFIKKYNTFEDKNKFNYTSGGDGGKKSIETRKKISNSHKGKKRPSFSIEWREKISKSLKGKRHSTETRRKMSKAAKERFSDGPHSNPMYGKSHSLETLLKLSSKKNSTGYFRVRKIKGKNKQGFYWSYRYFESGKRKEIASSDIKVLEKKIKKMGLPWIKL